MNRNIRPQTPDSLLLFAMKTVQVDYVYVMQNIGISHGDRLRI